MAPETPSSEERLLTTTGHISRALLVVELQRHANEIGTRNQTAGRTRPEDVTPRLWRSGRAIATGAVRTLHFYHGSPLFASVTNCASASRIGACRPQDASSENCLCPPPFTVLTNTKIHHYFADRRSVRTLHHGSRLSEKARLDPGGILGVVTRHLRRGQTSGHPHRPVLMPVHGPVIANHPSMEYRARDGGVAQYTRRQRTSTIAHPCVATRPPRLRVALRRVNTRALKVMHRIRRRRHLQCPTQRTAKL